MLLLRILGDVGLIEVIVVEGMLCGQINGNYVSRVQDGRFISNYSKSSILRLLSPSNGVVVIGGFVIVFENER